MTFPLGGSSSTQLTVDLCLGAYRLTGVLAHVDEANRLVDVLNNRDEVVFLRDVVVSDLDGAPLEEAREISVEKRFIHLVLPHESDEYVSRQRLLRAGMALPRQVSVARLVLVSPFAARGTLHVAPGSDLAFLERALARFFPITKAAIFFQAREFLQAPVVIVNRDLVASIGAVRGDASAQEREPEAGPAERRPLSFYLKQ